MSRLNLVAADAAQDGNAADQRGGTPDQTQMHRRLAQAISDLHLPPGTRLPEAKLARIFSTSRSKVKEVLVLLARDNLVELHLNRGAIVASPTVEEAKQICEARLVIERAMARLAAERIEKDDIDALRRLLERERACWDSADFVGAVKASREFHVALARVSGNEVLSGMLNNLLSRNALSMAVYAARGPSGCLCEDHFRILDALKRHDADAAERLMAEHVMQISNRMDLAPRKNTVDIERALRDTL